MLNDLNHIKTYYDTVEVSPSSSEKEIHTAYVKAKNTYSSCNPKLHSVFSKDEVGELLKLIDQAYFVLSDPEKRKAYDRQISTQQEQATKKSSKSQKNQSKYKINPIFEKQIEEQDVFDGPFLQHVRNYKNITLKEVSIATRIGKPYLIAIESNEYQSLPAPVFVRGFIIQYAKYLSLDPQKVADSYMGLYKALHV